MSARTEVKEEIKRSLIFVGGMAVGARCMYMLDPDRGRRRRAMARDKVVLAVHHAERTLDKGVRDLANRLQGLIATASSLFNLEPVDDVTLAERVRTRLGRAVSYPSAIDVAVQDGVVILSGPVLEHELPNLLWAVRSVGGVAAVEDQLSTHRSTEGVPGLQGPGRMRGADFELLREEWAPATRLVVGSAGGLLLAAGAWKRGLGGAALGAAGLSLIMRTLTNRTPERFFGLDGTAGVEVQKTVQIQAPLQQVFELLANPERLPEFMDHVQDIKKTGEKRYRWTISGPFNGALHWESEITELVPNQLLCWKSVPGAVVENAGVMQFSEVAGGATRVHIRWKYNPPAGEFGYMVARFFGGDLKRMLDQDLSRLKSLLERGKTTAHHHAVTLEQVAG